MSVPRIRLETVEAIARKILMEYDSSLLSGEPRPIPIEAIIEVKFDLILEYHILRKNGAVLGETIFDDGPVILYDMDERSYKIIAVRKGTILIDERLCETRSMMILFRRRILPLPDIRECLSQTERPSFLPLRLLPVTAQLLPKRRG